MLGCVTSGHTHRKYICANLVWRNACVRPARKRHGGVLGQRRVIRRCVGGAGSLRNISDGERRVAAYMRRVPQRNVRLLGHPIQR